MAYYLSKEREADISGSYTRYQEYLHKQRDLLPPVAFSLGTAMWYQNPSDHRCPHDAWLEQIIISEPAEGERKEKRQTSVRIRLFGAYHDGFIEFFYPRVFGYTLDTPSSTRGLGDWRYDEFRVSPAGHLLHEIEWAGFPGKEGSRWIIESSDVEFLWIPKT
jgi:hypothetical protein